MIELQLSQEVKSSGREHRGFLDVKQGHLAIRVVETKVTVAKEEEFLPAALSDVLQIKAADIRCRVSLSLLFQDGARQVLPEIPMNLQAGEAMTVACALPGDWVNVRVSGETMAAVAPVSCGQDETITTVCNYTFTGDDQDVQLQKVMEIEDLLVVALRKRVRLQVNGCLRQTGDRRCDICVSVSGDLGIAPRYVRTGSAGMEELRAAAAHHLSQDEYKQALTNFKAGLAMEQWVPKQTEPSTSSTKSFFREPKDPFRECAGDARTAITWHQEALAAKEKRLGQTMPNAAGTLQCIGDDYLKLQEYDKAIAHYQRALAIFSALDTKGADTAKALYQIARALELKGKWGEALETYSESLNIRKELHPRIFADQAIADSLCGIASVHGRMQEYKKAAEFYRGALKRRERSNGPEANETAATLMDLGNIYFQMGSKNWALDSFRRAFAIYQKASGPEHARTARALHHLGMIHSSLGQYPDAMEYYSRALRIREQDESLRTEAATTLNNIGVVLSRMGDCQRACTYHQRAYNIQKSALGIEHEDTVASLHNLQKANQAWQKGRSEGDGEETSRPFRGGFFGLFDLILGLRNCRCKCAKDADDESGFSYISAEPVHQNAFMEEVV